LKRIYSNNNGTEIHEEITIFEGKFINPSNGYYLFDLELKNQYSERKWSCDLVEKNKLICHGTLKLIGENQLKYESEIFEIIK
jgi:hypothetical protein